MDTTRASGEWRTTSSSGEWGLRLQPGAVVGGFVLEQKLGHGGMGAVFVGRALDGEQRVAIKVLLVGGDELRPEEVERFRREGQAQAAADAHPNILRVITSGDHLGHPFLVTELAPGGDLKARLRQGPLAPADAAALVAALARGMAHAHARGVLHRDLKPANVVFGEDDAPKVMDFGLARLAGAKKLTQTGAAIGTAAYMAPEQAAGERLDERVDVYGLGAILYECLVGQAPFAGGSEIAILKQVLADPVRPPRSLRPDLPAALEAIALRALAKDPAARHPTASALAEDLERFARDDAAAPAAGRWRRAVVVLAFAAGVVVAAAASSAGRIARDEPAPPPAPPTLRPVGPPARAPALTLTTPRADWSLARAAAVLELTGEATGGEVEVLLEDPLATAREAVATALPARIALPAAPGWRRVRVVVTPERGGAPLEETRDLLVLPAEGFEPLDDPREARGPEGSVLRLVPPPGRPIRVFDPLRPESPQEVELPLPYLLGLSEVTWAQYRAYAAREGREPPPLAPDQVVLDEAWPVYNVTWLEARDYCQAHGLRLPTASEWSYAATGGDPKRTYPWGRAPAPPARGERWPGGVVRANGKLVDDHPLLAPVGSFPQGAGPFGHLDLLGNVGEWLAPAGETLYGRFGGAWSDEGDRLRNDWFQDINPGARKSDTGLRVCWGPKPPG